MNSQIIQTHSGFEILHVNSKKVSCEGAKGSSTHPLVYLDMGENDSVICPYCSKFFTLKEHQDFKLKTPKKIKNILYSSYQRDKNVAR
jgi:uncharacterized Zn-finger protein